MAQHYYSSTSVGTTLSASVTNVSTSISVPEVAGDNGWPTSFPFTLALDYGSVGVELVDVTSKGILGGGQRAWNVTRGIDFTVASAHSSGAKVQHVIAARDFTEARQARTLQPLDTENTYIIREGTAGTEFTDSTVGDLIIKAKTGQAVLIGTDGSGFSIMAVSATNGVQTSLTFAATAGLRKGGGAIQGTNYIQVSRTSVVQAMTLNTWTDVQYNSITSSQVDDGSLYTSPNFTTRNTGFYSGVGTASFSALGAKSLRWITQGGSVVSLNEDNGGGTFSCPVGLITPGGGYSIKLQCNSTVAANLTISSATAPSLAYLCEVA